MKNFALIKHGHPPAPPSFWRALNRLLGMESIQPCSPGILACRLVGAHR